MNSSWLVISLFLSFSPLITYAEPQTPTVLQESMAFPNFRLKDQHENDLNMTSEIKLLIFTKNKAASAFTNLALEGKTPDDFSKIGLFYVADISGMPGIITSMFALPKMKKYTYRVALDTEGDVTKNWPTQPDSTTVFSLENGIIKTIQYVKSKEDLEKALHLK